VTQDLTLPPFVTISGKTTDANGVAVRNVILYRQGAGFILNGKYAYTQDAFTVSNATGDYSMIVLPYDSYTFTATPPGGSGFLQTTVNNINITTNILQNWIMAAYDTTPPVILSGPAVTNITDTSALVQWQTSKPAQGGVKIGTSNPPGTTLNETGYVISHSQVLTGLSADTLYYVNVFGSDRAGNAAAPSAVVSFRTQAAPDTTPPVIIEGPTITSITPTGAVVTWQTNEPSTGMVSYGLTTAFGQTVTDSTLATFHSVTLSGLTPETLYYLKVDATDAAGNGPTVSATVNFKTMAEPDTKAPVIVEGPMAINITATGATIVWRTDEPATSGVSFNDGTAYKVYSDNNLTTFHSVQLTGLTPATPYTYVVSSKDVFSNGPTLSSPKTFTTLPTPDSHPPVFTEDPRVVNVTHRSAIIRWKTDEPSDALIEFGITPAFGSTETRTALVTNHNIPLTGLNPGVLYYFRVLSKDAAGNGPTISSTGTFTTETLPNHNAPVITAGPQIVYSSDSRVTVRFETDIPCDTVVEYGQGSVITHRQSDSEKVYTHQIAITNLNPNSAYVMTVSCTDLFGNTMIAQADAPASDPTFKLTPFTPAISNGVEATGFTTQSQPDTTPPVILTDPVATRTSATQATIVWTTDELSDSQVSYHVNGQSLNYTVGDIAQGTNHSIILTNLMPSTAYQFTVTSFDPSGNPVTSAVFNLGFEPTSVTLVSFAAGMPPLASELAILSGGVLLGLVGWGVCRRKIK
jgi:hypothetical protein